VLFPNVSDAQRAWINGGISDALLLTGDESPKSRRATWHEWRTQANPILFGTRIASLWNRTDIATVFILRSSHPNHKQADRNPRFDARLLAWGRRQQGTTVFHLDATPRGEDILQISSINRIAFPGLPALHVVDRARERQAAPHPAIAYTTAERIAETLEAGKRVLCAFNRKGSALRMRCQSCREPVRCETCCTPMSIREGAAQCGRCRSTRSIPRSCHACGHNQLKQEGYGNESITRALGYLFPDATVSLYDKEHTDPTLLSSQIIVTTRAWLESAFDPFHPIEHIGLVIELDADAPLYETSFRSTESAIRNALEWRGAAHALRAQFLLQTDTPDVFYRIAENPVGVLTQDLETRRSYGYPPFRRILAVRYTTEDSREADRAYAALQRRIRDTIPDAKMQQKQALFISIFPEQAEQILSIFRELDDKYVIDTNVS
jgi:primosomal protein N' (replication factor Y)